MKNVIKRDGRRRKFNPSKILNAIKNAFAATQKIADDDILESLTDKVCESLETYEKNNIGVEHIQDTVEAVLMKGYPEVAKNFILYRNERNRVRDTKSKIISTIKEIKESDIKSSNILRDNANEAGNTPAGAYAKIASETNKVYDLLNIIDRKTAELHTKGYMHIHDLNMYDLTFNCLFAPISKLLSHGFDSGTGFIRNPSNIKTAAQITAVILQLQSNQQFGGIASTNLDFELAPFVNMSFIDNLAGEMAAKERYTLPEYADLDETYDEESHKKKIKDELKKSGVSLDDGQRNMYAKYGKAQVIAAVRKTDDDTYQAMEGLIHNLNSLQSRSGNQVPFSSLNFGLDTSICGRMLSHNLIKAQMAGLGDGLTAIFPILIFKYMRGVSYLKDDPNYDLRHEAIICLARRFYPNAVGVDNKFNAQYIRYEYNAEFILSPDTMVKKIGFDDMAKYSSIEHENDTYPRWEVNVNGKYWQICKGKLQRIIPESTVSTMGCRTRVIGNINGTEQTVGRGNLAFHTLNLPKLAIEAHIASDSEDGRIKIFYEKLDYMLDAVKKSLIDRFNLISNKMYENFPFTMQQGLYLTSDDKPHDIHDHIGEILKQGTLSIGYIGLYETILLLTGKTLGTDESIKPLGEDIVRRIYNFCVKTQKETHLNWSCFATPAEATAGRFCNIDKHQFEKNPKLKDVDMFQLFGKGYYTNSHMLPFDVKTTLENKVKWEAPFHEMTNAGHIFYYKIDGDLSKNIDGVEKCMNYMYEHDLGYFTVTMDSDTCVHMDDTGKVCHFHGVINGACPKCGNTDENYIVRVRRITGYLSGSPRKSITLSWNDGKLNELKNRVNI